MNKLSLFARLMKVDEAARKVYGVIASEAPDHAGEVLDYTTSVPFFKAWSSSVAEASNGASVGNLRAQHGNIVAGKLDSIEFDDLGKSISVVADVVDDNEWQKVLKGCYTGFSIGGAYGGKWDDTTLGKKRYTAVPCEVSLVDLPCNPEATFTVQKADGSNELRKYHPDSAAAATGDASPAVPPSDAAPAAAEVVQKALPLETDVQVRAAWAHVGAGADSDLRKAVLAAFTERFGAPASSGTLGMTKNAAVFDAVCAGILVKMREDNEFTQNAVEAIRTAVDGPKLEKGMYDCSALCDLLRQLGWCVNDAQWEAEGEGDGSKVPAMLVGVLRDMGQALIAMVQEEVAELVGTYESSMPVDVFALATPTGDLTKSTALADETTDAEIDACTDLDQLRGLAKRLLKANATNNTLVGGLRKSLSVADGASLPDAAAAHVAKLTKATDDLQKAHTAIHEQNAGLLKLRNDNAELTKAVKAQADEIALLKATPPTQERPLLKAVGKDGVVDSIDPSGSSDDATAVRDSDGNIDPVATAIKKAHAGGGMPLQKKLGVK